MIRTVLTRLVSWLPLLLAALGIWLAPLTVAQAAPQEREVHITASRFAYHPGTLRVNTGDRVTLRLQSLDVVHGLEIDGYPVEVTADPGQTAELSFIASRPGAFRFRCSVTCGGMHPFMIGKIQVGPNLLLWRMGGLSALAVVAGLWTLRPRRARLHEEAG